MLTINDTAPHYIRCIKPNDENEADFFHRSRVVAQLRYGGVLQAVQVARAGYPSRLKHKKQYLSINFWHQLSKKI